MTREEVRLLFLSVYGRPPQSEAVYEHYIAHHNFFSARNELLYTYEFFMIIKDRLSDFKNSYKACDYPMTPLMHVPKRPTLGVACIMKNEADHIGRMIELSRPFTDVFAVVDTGSEDASISIANEAAGDTPLLMKTVPFIDFAQARNSAIELIAGKSDWVLFLDADEYIPTEDHTKLLNLISVPETHITGWRLPRYNFLDSDRLLPPGHYPDYQQRLFRNDIGIHYRGSVHEQLGAVGFWGWAPMSDIASGGTCGGPHIHHTALIDMTPEVEVRKTELYRRLGAAF